MPVGDHAVHALRRYLEESGHRTPARLPPERDLSRALGLSRRALRTALDRLEAEGRLWRHVGRGTFLGARPPEDDVRSLVTARTSPAELMEVTLWLEPMLARNAAIRATRKEIDGFRYLLEQSETVADPLSWDLWDTRLHRAIVEASHNDLMLSMYDSFVVVRDEPAWKHLRSEATTPERFAELHGHHRAIVEAIAAHNPRGAEAAMRHHLLSVQDALLLGPADDTVARSGEA